MAEITPQAYANIREHINNGWTYIELQDDAGNAILRLGSDDARVSWIHQEGATALLRQVVITGKDTDITLPQTFAKSAIYNVATGGTAFSLETFNSFTLETVNDELTIVHELQIPQVV